MAQSTSDQLGNRIVCRSWVNGMYRHNGVVLWLTVGSRFENARYRAFHFSNDVSHQCIGGISYRSKVSNQYDKVGSHYPLGERDQG